MTPISKITFAGRATNCAALGSALFLTAPIWAQNNPPQFPSTDFNSEFAPAPTQPEISANDAASQQLTPFEPSAPFEANEFPRQAPIFPGAPPTNFSATADESAAWENFLSGRTAPLELKFSDMKSGWSSLKVQSAGDKSAAPLNRYPDPFFTEMVQRFGGEGQTAFTQGRTVSLNNELFLVVYRAKFPTFEQTNKFFESRFPRNAEPSSNEAVNAVRAWLDSIPLRASLLNTRNVSTVEDVTAFNFDAQFTPVIARIEADIQKGQAQRARAAKPAVSVAPPRTVVVQAPPPRTVVVQAPPPRSVVVQAPPTSNSASKPLAPKLVASKPVVPKPALSATDQMKTIYSAFTMWLEDNDGILPPLENLTVTKRALTPYLKNANLWNLPDGSTLQTNARLSKRRSTQLQPYQSALILFYSTPDATGTRTVLRLDGQVRRVKSKEWQTLRTAARLP